MRVDRGSGLGRIRFWRGILGDQGTCGVGGAGTRGVSRALVDIFVSSTNLDSIQ